MPHPLSHPSGENINIAWSPDSQHVAVGNKEDQITIIDTKKFKALKNTKFLFEVNEIAWDASGNFFFITTGNGTIEIMRYVRRQSQPEHTDTTHTPTHNLARTP